MDAGVVNPLLGRPLIHRDGKYDPFRHYGLNAGPTHEFERCAGGAGDDQEHRLDAGQRLPLSLHPLLQHERPAEGRRHVGRNDRPDRRPTEPQRRRDRQSRRQRAAVHERTRSTSHLAAVCDRPSGGRRDHRRADDERHLHPAPVPRSPCGLRQAERRRRVARFAGPGRAQPQPRCRHLRGSDQGSGDLPTS